MSATRLFLRIQYAFPWLCVGIAALVCAIIFQSWPVAVCGIAFAGWLSRDAIQYFERREHLPLVIGLTGHAGAGKDTLAAHLVKKYSYVRLAFGDILRAEIARAWPLIKPDILEAHGTKGQSFHGLAIDRCCDTGFIAFASAKVGGHIEASRTPREIMQLWGDYKRSSDPMHYLKAMAALMEQHEGQLLVISDVRPLPDVPQKANEVSPTKSIGNDATLFSPQHWRNAEALLVGSLGGEVWQINRDGFGPVNDHATDADISDDLVDLHINNDHHRDWLCTQVDTHLTHLARQSTPMAKTCHAAPIPKTNR